MTINLNLIDNVVIAGIDYKDYPDFCDAYIGEADYDGRSMTDEELEVLHDEYSDWVYERVFDWIH